MTAPIFAYGGAYVPPPQAPKPQPQHYGGDTGGAPGSVPPVAEPGAVAAPPAVPKGDGAGNADIKVDTASLQTFASNMHQLSEPVRAALDSLKQVKVAPGAFGEANNIRAKVHGQRDQYEAALTSLVEGLVDLSDKIGGLAKNYTTTEEANAMKGEDLQSAMAEPNSDFASMLNPAPSTGTA